ncbi:Uncharacterized protein PBTT_05185 [Plasmodiophora brassicae]
MDPILQLYVLTRLCRGFSLRRQASHLQSWASGWGIGQLRASTCGLLRPEHARTCGEDNNKPFAHTDVCRLSSVVETADVWLTFGRMCLAFTER